MDFAEAAAMLVNELAFYMSVHVVHEEIREIKKTIKFYLLNQVF